MHGCMHACMYVSACNSHVVIILHSFRTLGSQFDHL